MKYWTEIGEDFRLVSEGYKTRKKYCGNIMVLDLEVSWREDYGNWTYEK